MTNVNPNIAGLTPYQPGKPEEELARELGLSEIVKLASNENPRGPGPKVRAAIAAATESLARYPDGDGFELKQALASYLGRDRNTITLGSGSNDLLDLLARTTLEPGTEAIISEHAFVAYPLAIVAAGGTIVTVPAKNYGHDLDATLAAITERTRIIYIANPGNPTGNWNTHREVAEFLQQVPERVWVVLDQAYVEYISEPDFPDGLKLIDEHANLIMTRSFSKVYGLAALRVGYCVSSPLMADLLNRVRMPFNVNRLAQTAAVAALDDQDYVAQSRAINDAGLLQVGAGLARLGLDFIPGIGNFLCVNFARDAAPIYQQLLEQGVIVRPVAGYGLPNFLRITIGLEDENARLLDALGTVLA